MSVDPQYFKIPQLADFPTSISSTYMELLMRKPYEYYTKKILNLKSLERFCNKPSYASLGILIHNTLDRYTKQYGIADHAVQEAKFLEIARDELSSCNFEKSALWIPKIEGIAAEFVKFDEYRRSGLHHVYSEEKGKAKIALKSREITITSIVDRFEISRDSNVYILDYKTGVVPTLSDVERGLSPQMIVSAIIASEGGFACLNKPIVPSKLIYVKLASSSPYWQLSEILLDEKKLEAHKNAMIKVLDAFVEKGETFSMQPLVQSYQRYDEYSHFARLLP